MNSGSQAKGPRPSVAVTGPLPEAGAASQNPNLTFLDAAEQVLRQSGGTTPLHYTVITKRAVGQGFLRPNGLTPDATMRGAVQREVEQAIKQGRTPRFVRHGNGFIGLSAWLPKGLVQQIDQHNASVRKALRQRLFNMDPREFQDLIGELLVSIGFENVVVANFLRDGGIDARGILVVGKVINVKMAVQVKRWKNNVQQPTVNAVKGALDVDELGLIVTTSDFSRGAREAAQRPNATPVALMNGTELVALLVENGIGVRRDSYDLLELDDTKGF